MSSPFPFFICYFRQLWASTWKKEFKNVSHTLMFDLGENKKAPGAPLETESPAHTRVEQLSHLPTIHKNLINPTLKVGLNNTPALERGTVTHCVSEHSGNMAASAAAAGKTQSCYFPLHPMLPDQLCLDKAGSTWQCRLPPTPPHIADGLVVPVCHDSRAGSHTIINGGQFLNHIIWGTATGQESINSGVAET